MSIKPRSISQGKESGMVAIMVTLILMIIISLIVLGFAQISRRNQRQAVDRQLSTQAFYAAESGVNDAAELIKTAVQSGTAIPAKADCASTGGGFYTAPAIDPVIDSANEVEYTCLMVDPSPGSLSYTNVGTTGIVVPITAVGGTISRMNLTWNSKQDTGTPVTGCPTSATAIDNLFPPTTPSTNWPCGYGVARIDLVPTAGSLSMAGLQSATMTSFLVPHSAGGVASYNYAAGGANNLIRATCTNTSCTMTINNLNSTQYHLRMMSLYKNVSMNIQVFDASGNVLDIQGAQAVIDATGKAQDVLRRIQVRVPLSGSSSNLLSDFAIQSTEALCKRFSVMDGFFDSDVSTALGGPLGTNPLCQ